EERNRIAGGCWRSCVVSGNFAFDFRDMLERLVPARLQLAGNKPVDRIGSVVLAESPIDGKARRFKIALERLAHLVPPLGSFRLCRNGGRNGAGADDGEQRTLDGVVDAQTAKGNAARLAIVHPAAAAAIARNIVPCAGVAERQLSTAAAAADEPR